MSGKYKYIYIYPISNQRRYLQVLCNKQGMPLLIEILKTHLNTVNVEIKTQTEGHFYSSY